MLTLIIQLTRMVLFIERVWAAFALPLVVLFTLLASAAFGFWAFLPLWPHIGLLAVWLGASGWLFYTHRRAYPGFPSSEQGRVALERRHRLSHRPLTLAADKPAPGLSPDAQALFAKAQHQAGQAGRKAGPTSVRTQKLLSDKWALRYPVLILLVIALWADSDRGFFQLRQTFYPANKQTYLQAIQGVDAWVYPPEYTQEARFALKPKTQPRTKRNTSHNSEASKNTSQKAPQGSDVAVRLHVIEPLPRQPVLHVAGKGVQLTRRGQTYSARVQAEQAGDVKVSYGERVLFAAELDLIPDTPPEVALNPPLERTPEGMLDIPFTLKDDYGVNKVEVILTGDVANHEERVVTKELVIPKQGVREAETSSYVDFTADPFAGLRVDIQLKATDMAGQTTLTDAKKINMPTRPFHHPVAKKLVALRRDLFTAKLDAPDVAKDLRAIMAKPEAFDDNSRAYLSITLAEETLSVRNKKFVSRAMGLMWDAALHIEKGPLAMQMERLLNAQRDLQKALAEGASQEDLDKLFHKMRRAMADLLRQAQFGGDTAGMMDVPSLQNSDLANLMEEINSLLESGAHAEALKKLKQLEKLMAHVSMDGNQAMKQFQEAMRQVQDIQKQQEQLIEDAFENDVPGRLTPKQQMRQQMMAQKLREASQKLEKLGMDAGKLKEAAKAMEGAHELSKKPGMESFVNHLQNRALQMMGQGKKQMAQQLRRKMGYGGMAGMRRDPSGKLHSRDGGANSGEAVLPDEAPESLSRQIRDMLFDRAGQLKGSDVEHRYLQRLLEQF